MLFEQNITLIYADKQNVKNILSSAADHTFENAFLPLQSGALCGGGGGGARAPPSPSQGGNSLTARHTPRQNISLGITGVETKV